MTRSPIPPDTRSKTMNAGTHYPMAVAGSVYYTTGRTFARLKPACYVADKTSIGGGGGPIACLLVYTDRPQVAAGLIDPRLLPPSPPDSFTLEAISSALGGHCGGVRSVRRRSRTGAVERAWNQFRDRLAGAG